MTIRGFTTKYGRKLFSSMILNIDLTICHLMEICKVVCERAEITLVINNTMRNLIHDDYIYSVPKVYWQSKPVILLEC